MEVLKQDQYEPMAVSNQVAIIYAVTKGFLDDVQVEKVKDWERDFHKYLNSSAKDVLDLISEKKELSDEVIEKLEKAIKEFKEIYQNGN
jgi:F-type H+-transporting ATPase subunit alpha